MYLVISEIVHSPYCNTKNRESTRSWTEVFGRLQTLETLDTLDLVVVIDPKNSIFKNRKIRCRIIRFKSIFSAFFPKIKLDICKKLEMTWNIYPFHSTGVRMAGRLGIHEGGQRVAFPTRETSLWYTTRAPPIFLVGFFPTRHFRPFQGPLWYFVI